MLYIDKKAGITYKVNEAAEKMAKGLESHMKDPSKNRQRLSGWDPRYGLIFWWSSYAPPTKLAEEKLLGSY